MKILGIDPGPIESAFVLWDSESKLILADISDNETFNPLENDFDVMVIEDIQSFGMPVGQSIFETLKWSGEFRHIAKRNNIDYCFMPRGQIKLTICHSARAKDPNIRQALIDRFGEPGTKKNPGYTYGLKKDLWQAFAVAVTYYDIYVRKV